MSSLFPNMTADSPGLAIPPPWVSSRVAASSAQGAGLRALGAALDDSAGYEPNDEHAGADQEGGAPGLQPPE
eukprot:4799725-Alexandrium_andersonii.AAC.1